MLSLLSGGIAMFAAALALLRRHSVRQVAGSRPPVIAVLDPVAPAVPKPPETVVPEVQALAHVGADDEPTTGVAHPAEEPALGGIPIAQESDAPPFDVTRLMGAPLSDLLLAAMCKDPVGARRIFARALELQAATAAPVESTTSTPAADSPMAPTGDRRPAVFAEAS